MRDPARGTQAEGQILVIFALSIITLLGFAGLAIDGGSMFAQQRDQQTASDLAALAGANDFLINNSETTAETRARGVAQANGYLHASGGTVVDVVVTAVAGASVKVTITALHQNMMAGLLGMPTWTVTTTGTALAGFPDTAYNASPFIFSVLAFGDDGTPLYQTPTPPTTFFHKTGPKADAPQSADAFAFTNYGTGSVNTNDLHKIMCGDPGTDKELRFGDYIGQDNNGVHVGAWTDMPCLIGRDVPAAVTDANGNFAGWSTFHVSGADGSAKSVSGYFLSAFESARLSVTACAANNCPRYLGSYVLKLSD